MAFKCHAGLSRNINQIQSDLWRLNGTGKNILAWQQWPSKATQAIAKMSLRENKMTFRQRIVQYGGYFLEEKEVGLVDFVGWQELLN